MERFNKNAIDQIRKKVSDKEKCIFCWSGGKDSAMALYKVLTEGQFEVVALLTTLNENYKRISMHGVQEELLDKQAASIGFPLIKMYVKEGTNEEYEKNMEKILLSYKAKGVTTVIFGDIFLEDLRLYRENNLAKVGLKAAFPLWKKNTKKLINEFLELNFKTITCCVSDAYLNEDRVGVVIDEKFIEALPSNVDPCGENGEFHTFCYSGPIFKTPVKFKTGEKIYKPLQVKTTDDCIVKSDAPIAKGFWFCDLIP